MNILEHGNYPADRLLRRENIKPGAPKRPYVDHSKNGEVKKAAEEVPELEGDEEQTEKNEEPTQVSNDQEFSQNASENVDSSKRARQDTK